MRTLVFQYLEALARTQEELGQTAGAIEKRLASSRSQRLSVAPVCAPPDLRVLRRDLREELAAPQSPVSPPGLAEDVRAAVAVEPAYQPPREVPPLVPSASPRSLVHRQVVVGNRRQITLLVLQRLTVEVDGEPGLADLFPGFKPGEVASFEVEVSLHQVDSGDQGEDIGIEIGPLVSSLVAQGWSYRAMPWIADVRRKLLTLLRLAAGFEAVPANSARASPPGLLPGGSCFVVLAVDPASGRPRIGAGGPDLEVGEPLAAEADRAAAEEQVATGAMPAGLKTAGASLGMGTGSRELPGEPGVALPGAEAVQAGRDSEPRSSASLLSGLQGAPTHPTSEATLPPWALEQVRAAWRSFQEHHGGPAGTTGQVSFPEFLANWVEPMSVNDVVSESGPGATPALRFDRLTLVRKYKHAPDFGIHERFSDKALEHLVEALCKHVAEAVDRHLVRWRGRMLVAHVGSGRLVWTELDGTFVTGYRALPGQLRHVWAQSEWRAS